MDGSSAMVSPSTAAHHIFSGQKGSLPRPPQFDEEKGMGGKNPPRRPHKMRRRKFVYLATNSETDSPVCQSGTEIHENYDNVRCASHGCPDCSVPLARLKL